MVTELKEKQEAQATPASREETLERLGAIEQALSELHSNSAVPEEKLRVIQSQLDDIRSRMQGQQKNIEDTKKITLETYRCFKVMIDTLGSCKTDKEEATPLPFYQRIYNKVTSWIRPGLFVFSAVLVIWKDLGLVNGMEDEEAALDEELAALPVDAGMDPDEENGWMTRWVNDKVSMLRANFPGESLQAVAKHLADQHNPVAYVKSLDFAPEYVSCEYHTAYSNPGFIAKLQAMGVKVALWTVDTEKAVRSLLPLGPDCIVTNRPDRVREWVEENQ